MIIEKYDRKSAVQYAKAWALKRNNKYYNFDNLGGDCTNFVSQCVLAGCCTQNFTPDFGWYYISVDDRSPSWTSVEFFYDFFTGSGNFPPKLTREGPLGMEVNFNRVETGDIVQLYDSSGDFYHTLIVSEIRDGEILVCAQSDNALDRPLSTYVNASGARFIHIQAALVDVPDDTCFNNLIEGISIE